MLARPFSPVAIDRLDPWAAWSRGRSGFGMPPADLRHHRGFDRVEPQTLLRRRCSEVIKAVCGSGTMHGAVLDDASEKGGCDEQSRSRDADREGRRDH
jgi:hypothetical protein